MSTSGGHAPYGRRHVLPSEVSLADVYASPAKPVLAGVCVLPAPTGQQSRLSADIGRESKFIYLFIILSTSRYTYNMVSI